MNLIRDKFLRWENDYKVYELKHEGIPYWSFLRPELYQILYFKDDELSILRRDANAKKAKITTYDYFRLLFNCLSTFVKISKIRNAKVICFTNSFRRTKYDGFHRDYFFDKISRTSNNHSNRIIIEFPSLGEGFLHHKNIPNKSSVIKGDIFYLIERLLQLRKVPIDEDGISYLLKSFSNLYFEIHQEQVDLSFLNKFSLQKISRNLSRTSLYKYLFKIAKNCKSIGLVSSYTPMSQLIIHSAKKEGVKIVEFQHGHIYPDHIGYIRSYYEKLLPDKIVVTSEYYKNQLMQNEWGQDQLINIGDFTLKNELVHANDDVRLNLKIPKNISKVVTVIGQHTISKNILKFIANCNQLKNYFFIIKLHPRQLIDQMEIYFPIKDYDNVYLESEASIEACFEISDIVLGAYSTAIIDALNFGIDNVYLMKIGGSELLDDLVENKYISIVNSLEEIVLQKSQGEKKRLYQTFNNTIDVFQ